jgi:DmsE family decaheme c-type cytochrome
MKKVLCVFLALFVFFLSGYAQKTVEGDTGYVGTDTCKGCHSEYYDSYAKSTHARKAVPGSPANLNACESCHGPGSAHVEKGGGKGTGMFVFNKKTDAKDKAAKCLSCHEESKHLAFWSMSKHKSEGLSCDNCHSIHGGRDKFMKAYQPELCFGCHKDIKAQTNKQSHHPIREGKVSCSDCHDPHGTFGQKMVKADTVNELCFKCHAEKRGPFMWEHPPVEENCLTCHVVHGSNHTSLLVSKIPYLCQNCHTGSGHPRVPYGPFDSSFTGATGNPPTGVTQRPKYVVRGCVNCHVNIHGSNGPVGTGFGREQGKRFVR